MRPETTQFVCGAVRTDDRRGHWPCVLDTHNDDRHADARGDAWSTEPLHNTTKEQSRG